MACLINLQGGHPLRGWQPERLRGCAVGGEDKSQRKFLERQPLRLLWQGRPRNLLTASADGKVFLAHGGCLDVTDLSVIDARCAARGPKSRTHATVTPLADIGDVQIDGVRVSLRELYIPGWDEREVDMDQTNVGGHQDSKS